MNIGKNIKNKEGLLRIVLGFLKENGGAYVFPANTTLKLWYFEKQEEHRLLSLEIGADKKSIVIVTIVDGEREVDNLCDFDFGEMKSIIGKIV